MGPLLLGSLSQGFFKDWACVKYSYPSENWTSPVFKWSKVVLLWNGPVFEPPSKDQTTGVKFSNDCS